VTYPVPKAARPASSWYVPPLVVVTLFALATILFTAPPAGAAGRTATLNTRPVPEGPDEDAVSMLLVAARAIRFDSYSGRQQVTIRDGDGRRSMVLSVSHAPGTGSLVQLPSAGSGSTDVFSPDEMTAAGILPLDERVLRLLTTNYRPRLAGSDMVAGRPTTIVELRTAKGQVVAAFWLDELTSLPLRRVVYDDSGQEIRRSEFRSVRIDEPAKDMPRDPSASDDLAPEGKPLTAAAVRRLGASGWSTPSALPQGLDLVDSRLTGKGEAQVLHLTYSDGLSTLSVFEQPGRLDTDKLHGWRQERCGGTTVWSWPGAPLSVTWSAHGRVFSVVSDDADRLDDVVAQLPHAKHPSVLSRMRAGAHRLFSWVNPFG
jgi:sigma-E factor negative regulatory protein RseB